MAATPFSEHEIEEHKQHTNVAAFQLSPFAEDAGRGCIIGVARVDDCVRDSTDPWAMRACYHWLLSNSVLVREPVRVAPHKGICIASDTVVTSILKHL